MKAPHHQAYWKHRENAHLSGSLTAPSKVPRISPDPVIDPLLAGCDGKPIVRMVLLILQQFNDPGRREVFFYRSIVNYILGWISPH